MPFEIERKFLISGNGWRGAWPSRPIRQGYLTSHDATTVRVRLIGSAAFLTVKAECGGAVRLEYEYEIPVAHAVEMLQLCRRPLVEKVRYEIPFAGQVWEVDEFLGENAGLLVAEIELAHPDVQPSLPPWIGREITDDVRYRNSHLARHPFRTWRSAA
jgi:adenylate cyclase